MAQQGDIYVCVSTLRGWVILPRLGGDHLIQQPGIATPPSPTITKQSGGNAEMIMGIHYHTMQHRQADTGQCMCWQGQVPMRKIIHTLWPPRGTYKHLNGPPGHNHLPLPGVTQIRLGFLGDWFLLRIFPHVSIIIFSCLWGIHPFIHPIFILLIH